MEFKKLLVSSALLAGMMGISANTVSAAEKNITDEFLNMDVVEIDPGHDVNYKPNQSSEQTTEDSIWLDYPGDGAYSPDPEKPIYSTESSEEPTSHKDQEIKKENQVTSSTQENTKEVQENTPITSKEATKVLSTDKKDKTPSVSTVAIKETKNEGNTTEINEGTLPQTGAEDAAAVSAAGAALIAVASFIGYSVFSKKIKK